jgi:hypothetical protein
MTINDIASRIPAEYRREILETNMISQAVANVADTSMYYLLNIWQTYVDPGNKIDVGCGLCREQILKNYREMQQTLVNMEKQSNLLTSL